MGTELAVACAERESDHVLVLSTKKGCWLRTVPAADNPGLWLLDMVRRAAAGLPQAEGTGFLPAGQTKQSDPPGRSQSKDPPPKKKHPLRVLLAVLVFDGRLRCALERNLRRQKYARFMTPPPSVKPASSGKKREAA